MEQPLDLEKLVPLKFFNGLKSEAITFIYEYGDWKDNLPDQFEEEYNVEEMCIIFDYVEDMEKVIFCIIDKKMHMFGAVYQILQNDYGEYILTLKEFILSNGKVVREVYQCIHDDIIFMCLEINGEQCFTWSDEEIDRVLKEGLVE